MRLQQYFDYMYYEALGDQLRTRMPTLPKSEIKRLVPEWEAKSGVDAAVDKYLASHYVESYMPLGRYERFILTRRLSPSAKDLIANPDAKGEVVFSKDFKLQEHLEAFRDSEMYEKAAQEKYPDNWRSKEGTWETLDTRDTGELWSDGMHIGRHTALLETFMDRAAAEGGYEGKELQAVKKNQKDILGVLTLGAHEEVCYGSLG